MGPWWQQVLETLGKEFSDLPDAARAAQFIVRSVMALVLGGVLGYERTRARKAAGLRTYMLVALGTALFVLVPQQAGASDAAISRVIQGLIAGIGFLGGGVILKMSEQGQIRGLTTAAGIWLTAAVGVAVGMGRIVSACLATLLGWIVLELVPYLERYAEREPKNGRRPPEPGEDDDGKRA